jgi:uncharacterized protein
MTSVVFDTVVLVRGLMDPYSWRGKVLFDYTTKYRLIVAKPVVEEYLRVINRPELTSRYKIVPGRGITAVLDIINTAKVVDLQDIPRVCRDPGDDKLVATAKAGGAQFIVTEDLDLLVLGEHDGIRVVSAETFLKVIV